MRADFFGPDGDTTVEPRRSCRCDTRASATSPPTSAIARRCSSCSSRERPDVDHPLRGAAVPRPGRQPSLRRLRRQRRRHLNLLEAARRRRPRVALRVHEHQQGLRRRSQRDPAGRARRRAGSTPTRGLRRHRRVDADRPVEALAVRRVEGGGRRDGAGVRPLLRHADRLRSAAAA